jgi:hypothetical protein
MMIGIKLFELHLIRLVRRERQVLTIEVEAGLRVSNVLIRRYDTQVTAERPTGQAASLHGI